MAQLIYSMIASLDGYIADENGEIDPLAPDEEVHAFINDLERPIGTYLYGRRMYEMMIGWETEPGLAAESSVNDDFARIWQAAEKIVYSRTLEAVSTTRTRIERDFDAEEVRRWKTAANSDISLAGPTLAAPAFRAGLVDECHLFLAPVLIGGGQPVFPEGVRCRLELLAERRFGSGTVHLHYRAVR